MSLRKNARMSPYPHHKLHTHTLFLGTTPPNPRVQRHLRELWVYRKPRTQDNSESQVLNSGRPCTSHILESLTTENLRCLGFLNQKTCPVCRSVDPPRGKSPYAPAARSLRTTRSDFQSPKTSKSRGNHSVRSSTPCQALAEDSGPKRNQTARNPRAAGRTEWALLTRQRRHSPGRGQHRKDHPAAAPQVRARLRSRKEDVSAFAAGCTAYGALGGPNSTWHGDPPWSPSHLG